MSIPLLVAILAACEPYEPRLHLASCSSEHLGSTGVRRLTTYDENGWPTLEELQVPGAEPVIASTEYSRVAGRVVESLTIIDGIGYTRFYDGHEHLRSYTTNGSDPAADYECSLQHDNRDRVLLSTCSNGVDTVYDDCQNPKSIVSEGAEQSLGYTYNVCQILAGQILAIDEVGPWSENFQFSLGREVSRVTEREGALMSSFTTWDCPEPVE